MQTGGEHILNLVKPIKNIKREDVFQVLNSNPLTTFYLDSLPAT